jgi:hypothetical protein
MTYRNRDRLRPVGATANHSTGGAERAVDDVGARLRLRRRRRSVVVNHHEILASGATDAPPARHGSFLRWAVFATLLGCVPFAMWSVYLGWATGSPVRDLLRLPPLWLAVTAVPLLAGAGCVSLAVSARSRWSTGDDQRVGKNPRWTIIACLVATSLGVLWVVLLAGFLLLGIMGALSFS